MTLSGDVTVFTAASLQAELVKAVAGGGDVTIAMDAVATIDGAGLQLLAAAQESLKQGGRRLVLVGVPSSVAETIRLAGLDELLTELANPIMVIAV